MQNSGWLTSNFKNEFHYYKNGLNLSYTTPYIYILCNIILHLLPSGGRIYFSLWIWTGLVTCFSEQTDTEMTLPVPSLGSPLDLSLCQGNMPRNSTYSLTFLDVKKSCGAELNHPSQGHPRPGSSRQPNKWPQIQGQTQPRLCEPVPQQQDWA